LLDEERFQNKLYLVGGVIYNNSGKKDLFVSYALTEKQNEWIVEDLMRNIEKEPVDRIMSYAGYGFYEIKEGING